MSGDNMFRKNKGMTILEVMVALFLLTIMIGSVFQVFLVLRNMDLSSKANSDARQTAQNEIEYIYTFSKNFSYTDSLYQEMSNRGFTCPSTEFTCPVDPVTLEVVCSVPTSVVHFEKTTSIQKITMVFSNNSDFTSGDFKNITISVYSINKNKVLKRYETIYATSFK